jgi:phosphoribosylanthranilate isomerase
VAKVGLFVDAPPAEIDATVAALGLDLIQLHGAYTPADCARWPGRYLRALPADRAAQAADYPDAAAILLDTPSPGHGGSGQIFDWSLAAVAVASGRPLFLAGGLTPANVADAVRSVRPYAVDVASGVESSPGIKDFEKMRVFIAAAKVAS